jgi:hypothetical protein
VHRSHELSDIAERPDGQTVVLDADEGMVVIKVAEANARDQSNRPDLYYPVVKGSGWHTEHRTPAPVALRELGTGNPSDVPAHHFEQVRAQSLASEITHKGMGLLDSVAEVFVFKTGIIVLHECATFAFC